MNDYNQHWKKPVKPHEMLDGKPVHRSNRIETIEMIKGNPYVVTHCIVCGCKMTRPYHGICIRNF